LFRSPSYTSVDKQWNWHSLSINKQLHSIPVTTGTSATDPTDIDKCTDP